MVQQILKIEMVDAINLKETTTLLQKAQNFDIVLIFTITKFHLIKINKMEWSLKKTIGTKDIVKMGKKFNKKVIKMEAVSQIPRFG
jgi:hypothetical protein